MPAFAEALRGLVRRRERIGREKEDTRRFDIDTGLRRRIQGFNERIQAYNELSGNREFGFRTGPEFGERKRATARGEELTTEQIGLSRELGRGELAERKAGRLQEAELSRELGGGSPFMSKQMLLSTLKSEVDALVARDMSLIDAIDLVVETYMPEADEGTKDTAINYLMSFYGGMVSGGERGGPGAGGGLLETIGKALTGGMGSGTMRSGPMSIMSPGVGGSLRTAPVSPTPVPSPYQGMQPPGRTTEQVMPTETSYMRPRQRNFIRTAARLPRFQGRRRV